MLLRVKDPRSETTVKCQFSPDTRPGLVLPLRVQNSATPLLTELLKAVSRSFYLTLRVLPGSVRPQIGLAYLLARTTDTIADTELIPIARRLAALNELRTAINADRPLPPDFDDLAAAHPDQPGGGSNAERVLLQQAGEIVDLLQGVSPADRQCIREVLSTITSGQELDLQRFGNASAERILSLRTEAELDDYTYRVAGCVGEFWTKMCRAHVFPEARLDDAVLVRDGIRFGKGLQLVNILRDLPRDLKQGRCYLPSERLERAQLLPASLLDPSNIERFRPLYNEWLDLAEAHLAAGWRYTNALPRGAVRVRLACAWPVLIGVKTLGRLRRDNPLDATQRVKVSRADVKSIIGATVVKYPFARAWENLFARAKG